MANSDEQIAAEDFERCLEYIEELACKGLVTVVPDKFQRIKTRCPSCGNETLFVSPTGNLTCSWLKCPEPAVEFAILKLKDALNMAYTELNAWSTAINKVAAIREAKKIQDGDTE